MIEWKDEEWLKKSKSTQTHIDMENLKKKSNGSKERTKN